MYAATDEAMEYKQHFARQGQQLLAEANGDERKKHAADGYLNMARMIQTRIDELNKGGESSSNEKKGKKKKSFSSS